METEESRLAFDGLATCHRGNTGVILYAPDSVDIFLALKLRFNYTNNKAEDEALVL